MKIVFHCVTESYLEAATLEEFLKKQGIKYEERINDGTTVHRESNSPAPRSTTPIRRHKVTAEVYSQIKNYIKLHPNWSDEKIKTHYNLRHSSVTINRIRNGAYGERFLGTHRVLKSVL